MTKSEIQAALASWPGLNHVLTTAGPSECVQLLKAEADGRRRQTFLMRIHARLNKTRADTERLELTHLTAVPGSKARFLEKWR